MSLLNQMLNDLENRRADEAGQVIHRDVRSLPVAAKFPWGRVLGVSGAVMALLAGLSWAWFAWGPGRPLPAVAPALAAQVVESSLPALVASAPVAVPLPVATTTPETVTAPLPVAPAAQRAPTRVVASTGLRLDPGLSIREPAAISDIVPSAAPLAGIEKKPLAAAPAESAERLYQAALGLLGQGRENEGLTTLRAALKEDPLHPSARQLLIKYYIDSRAYDAAQGVLEDGLKLLPKQTAWAMLLSRLLADRGDNAGALMVLQNHEAHSGNAADYQGAIGAVMQRLNRSADAEQRFVRAVQLDPGNGRWWIGAGLAREAQGKSGEAREAFHGALAAKGLSPELRAFAETKVR